MLNFKWDYTETIHDLNGAGARKTIKYKFYSILLCAPIKFSGV